MSRRRSTRYVNMHGAGRLTEQEAEMLLLRMRGGFGCRFRTPRQWGALNRGLAKMTGAIERAQSRPAAPAPHMMGGGGDN